MIETKEWKKIADLIAAEECGITKKIGKIPETIYGIYKDGVLIGSVSSNWDKAGICLRYPIAYDSRKGMYIEKYRK